MESASSKRRFGTMRKNLEQPKAARRLESSKLRSPLNRGGQASDPNPIARDQAITRTEALQLNEVTNPENTSHVRIGVNRELVVRPSRRRFVTQDIRAEGKALHVHSWRAHSEKR